MIHKDIGAPAPSAFLAHTTRKTEHQPSNDDAADADKELCQWEDDGGALAPEEPGISLAEPTKPQCELQVPSPHIPIRS